MKRLFSILLISFVGLSTMYAQNDTTNVVNENVTGSNVEKLVDKYSGKIEAGIASLAKTLKQPAEHVYMILVRQQYVEASTYLSFWLLTFIFLIIFLKVLKRSKWSENDSAPDHEKFNRYATFSIITGALTFIFFLISFVNIDIVLQGFINPEYGAIMDIVDMFKK